MCRNHESWEKNTCIDPNVTILNFLFISQNVDNLFLYPYSSIIRLQLALKYIKADCFCTGQVVFMEDDF